MDAFRRFYLGIPNFLETYGVAGFIIIGFLSVSVQYGIIVQVALLWLYAGLFYLAINYGPSLIMVSYLGIRIDDDEEEQEEPTLARLKIKEPYVLMLAFLFIYSYFYYNTTDDMEVFIFRVKVFLLKYTNFGVAVVYRQI